MTSLGATPAPTFVGRASPVFRWIVGFILAIVVVSTLGLTLTAESTDDRIGGVVSLVVAVVLVGGVVAGFGHLTLRVLPDEVEVRYGATPFRSRIRLAQVQHVDTTHVGFLQWGGFGYRGSRRFFKRAAIVVRSGPAVRMHLDDGTWLAVTVDEAEAAADAIRHARGG